MFGSVIIKIKEHDLLKISNQSREELKIIKKQDDHFIVKIQYDHLSFFKASNITYEIISYTGVIKTVFFLKTNISIFFGIILFVSILYVNSITIKRIEFNASTSENEQIEAIIRDHLDSYFSFYFLNADLNELNFKLRQEFSHFEWISVQRKGTVLQVTVLKPTVINKKVIKRDDYGDLLAKKSGIIKYYQIEHGVLVVAKEQYVKKGTVLVSGNLRINRPESEPFYIHAIGEVHALVHYTKQIEVDKVMTKNEYTGKITTKKAITLFGWNIVYKDQDIHYEDYDKFIDEKNLALFKIKLPISTKKIYYYEKDDIIKRYDEQSAYDYAVSSAKKSIMSSFSGNDEIVDVILLNQSESNQSYQVQLLIITNENIAEFQRRHVDE